MLTAFAVVLAASGVLHAQACKSSSSLRQPDWPVYGGQAGGDHYSPLSQINRGNVQELKQAWKFDAAEEGGLETSPIIIGRTLFAYTASQKVIALEASTGKLVWKFDSGVISKQPARGLAYWANGQHGRILAGVTHYLYALDAQTGKVIPSFGEQGRIDLRKDLRGDYLSQSVDLTSPGIVYQDLIIVGGRNPETYPSPPGILRPIPLLPETFAPSMCVAASFGGAFTPSHTQVNSATLHGLQMPGKPRARPTTGPGWRSMKSAVSCTFRRGPRSSISTEQIG